MLDGDVADEIAVAARVDEGDGVGLFVVPQGAAEARRVVALDASRPSPTCASTACAIEADRVLGTPGRERRGAGTRARARHGRRRARMRRAPARPCSR